MATYNEQIAALAEQYQAATGRTTYTSKEVGAWAIDARLREPQRDSLIRQFAEDLSRAFREQYITDPQGRRVRAKHAIRQDGEQGALWADIHLATREHLEAAFQQRRQQIVADCRQLKSDVDSYNDSHNTGRLIQMVFDFTLDLEELELADA
ncbi:MAG: hypothetical protein ABIX28_12460 [Vicinamibacterales bacterium]